MRYGEICRVTFLNRFGEGWGWKVFIVQGTIKILMKSVYFSDLAHFVPSSGGSAQYFFGGWGLGHFHRDIKWRTWNLVGESGVKRTTGAKWTTNPNPRPAGGGGGAQRAPCGFSQIAPEVLGILLWNLPYLSGQHFHTLCQKITAQVIIGQPWVTSEWRHVLPILTNEMGLRESPPLMQF